MRRKKLLELQTVWGKREGVGLGRVASGGRGGAKVEGEGIETPLKCTHESLSGSHQCTVGTYWTCPISVSSWPFLLSLGRSNVSNSPSPSGIQAQRTLFREQESV